MNVHPTYHPAHTETVVLTGTVTANRFVLATGAQAGADAGALGVAATSGVAGDAIPVHTLGTMLVEAGAAIAVGDVVKSDASGRAIPWATSGVRLGRALSAASAAGQLVKIHIGGQLS